MGARVRGALLTFVIGILAGYVVAAVAGMLLQDNPLLGGSSESREARTYMIGLLQSEPDKVAEFRPSRDLISRAIEFQSTEEARGQVRPVSLTYIGGATQGRVSIHIYAVELQTTAGQQRFFPLALTIANGKVVRRE